MKRRLLRDDPLGHLIPRGTMSPAAIRRAVLDAMDRMRFRAGTGVPTAPTRYVVAMNPADRAWLEPGLEDRIAREAAGHASRGGPLVLGPIDVAFRPDKRVAPGTLDVWAGFADTDLLVLADAEAALEVFARA